MATRHSGQVGMALVFEGTGKEDGFKMIFKDIQNEEFQILRSTNIPLTGWMLAGWL